MVQRISLKIITPFSPLTVTGQAYETHVFLETVILGNEALFKCSVPSFVADFVAVESWTDSEGGGYHRRLAVAATGKTIQSLPPPSYLIIAISFSFRNWIYLMLVFGSVSD